MKKTIFIFGLLFAPFLAIVSAVQAEIQIENAYARATPPGQKTSGAFMTIYNHNEKDIALISAQSDAAKKVELHTHENDNGVMRMREVNKIRVHKGSKTELKPGGFHIMLIDLNAPLKPEEHINLILNFDDGSHQTFKLPIQTVMQGMQMDHKKMDHSKMGMDKMKHDMGSMKMDHNMMPKGEKPAQW